MPGRAAAAAAAAAPAGAVAGTEPEAGESAGDARDFEIEFTPGEAYVLMANHESFAIRETGGGVRHGLRYGLFQEGRCGPAGIAERWQATSVTPGKRICVSYFGGYMKWAI